MSNVPANFNQPQPKSGTQVAAERETKWEAQHRRFVIAMENAIERGKLRPYEVMECARHFGVIIPTWVEERHEYYSRTNGVVL